MFLLDEEAEGPAVSVNRAARDAGLALMRAGADHVTLGIVAREGPAALDRVTREVAVALRDAAGGP